MRFFLILLLVSLSFAQAPEIKRSISVDGEVECPGDILHFEIRASDGSFADNVELRLVLHYPYQGLTAIKNVDGGIGSFQLTKNGTYRIYIKTEQYNHDDFVQFDYPKMCPPVPQRQLALSIDPDCSANTMIVKATDPEPVKDAIISSGNWSTTTNSEGEAIVPFVEGINRVSVSKENYTGAEQYFDIDCNPPECLENNECGSDEICSNFSCIKISGDCGFAQNHSWYQYQCCGNSDCNGSICINNSCKEIITNEIIIETEKPATCASLIGLLLLLFIKV